MPNWKSCFNPNNQPTPVDAMNAKHIIRLALLAVVLGSVAVWGAKEYRKTKAIVDAATKPAPAETVPAVQGGQVVMTYFLGGTRCPSCVKIEAFTKATAEKDFAAELASGKLVFRIINTDEPANRHYIDDYKLASKMVVISHRVDGKQTEWQAMEKIWDLLDDESAFRTYLGETLHKYLDS
jgi:hypothetical protein